MLADWYFCSALMTPPAAAQPFLEILDILDSPNTSPDLLHDAIAELDRCDPWMRVYAAHRLLAAVRRVPAGGASAELAHNCLSRLSQALPGTMGHAVRDATAALLVDHERKRTVVTLTALATRCVRAKGADAPKQPYIDLPDYYAQSLLLSFLLDFVAGGGSLKSLVDTTDDDSPVSEFLLAAECGKFGRLAVLLVARLAALVEGGGARDRLLDLLWDSSMGVPWLEPDLLAATAWLLFDADRSTRPTTAEPLEFEAVTGTELQKLRAVRGQIDTDHATREAAVFERLGGGEGPTNAWSLVLWQMVLWELAVKRHPVDAAARLRQWWRAPDRDNSGAGYPGAPVDDLLAWRDNLNVLLALRKTTVQPFFTRHNDQKLDFTADRAAEVFSPWMHRNHDVVREWKPDPDGTRPQDWWSYRMDRGAGLLRFLAAVPIAIDLLRHPQVHDRHHLLEFVVHAKDVLAGTELRQAWSAVEPQQPDASATPLPAPLRGLALYVNYNVERVGRGTLVEIEPSWFVNLVLADASPVQRPGQPYQAWLLHRRASRLALVLWLTEVLSAITGSQDPDPHARWLVGAPSPAHRLIESVLSEVGDKASYTPFEARNAALIARFRLMGIGFNVRSWNWRTYKKKHAPWQWYLLAESLALTDWDQAFDRLGRSDNGLSRLAGFTQCLAALLHSDVAPEVEPRVSRWSEAWLSEITAVSEPRQFPRHLQIKLVQLLDLKGLTGYEWQRWALEQIIDALVEFGIRKPAELSMIFRALSQAVGPAELLAVLRSRFLEVVYLSQQVRRSGATVDRQAISPWLVARGRTSAALFDLSLRKLLHQLRDDEPAVQNTRSPREQARISWAQATRSPELESTTMTAGHAVEPTDSRMVVGITVDPARDLVQTHRLHPAWSENTVADLFGAPESRAKFLDALGRDCRPAVGIVCADQPGDVWVNCGFGQPVAAPAEHVPTPWLPRIGEFVAVPLRRNDTTEIRCEVGDRLKPLGRRAAVSHEVRIARLSTSQVAGRQVVQVRVDDVEFELTPQLTFPWRWTPESLNQWDPDLSRGHRVDAGDSWQTLAHWDEVSQRWMPVDRTLTELIADGVQDGSHRGVVALVGRSEGKWRLSTAPGLNYVVADADWWAGDADRLAAKAEETGSDVTGLLVYVELATDDDGVVSLRLMPSPPTEAQGRWPGLDPNGPFDYRNLRWREALDAPVLFGKFDGQHWFYDTEIQGFPPVRINGLPTTDSGDGPPFMPERWGWSDQRLAVVEATQQVSFDMQIPSSDDRSSVFERLHALDEGSRVELRLAYPLKDDSLDCRPALTAESLHVLVTAESINPGQEPNRAMQFSGRPAEVIRIEDERSMILVGFSPLSTAQLLDQVEPELRREAEAALQTRHLRGLVASSPKTKSAVQTYGLWLDINGQIVDFTLHVKGMIGRPAAAGSRVFGQLTAQGWEFTASSRKVVVQALWSVSEGSSDLAGNRRQGTNRSVSIPVVLGGTTYQAALSADTFHIQLIKRLSPASGQSHGDVEVTRRGRTVVTRDGQTRRSNRVVVGYGRDKPSTTGQTWQSRLPNPARLIREQLELEEAVDGWYALSHEFVFAAVGADRGATKDTLDERRQEKLDQYFANPRPVRASLQEDVFILADLQVRAGARWTNRVHASESELAWIDGNDYDAGNARVLVHQTPNGYAATCRDVPPHTLSQFVRQFQLGTNLHTDQDVPRLYFAGVVTPSTVDETTSAIESYVRFEWGYGQVLAVPFSHIRIGSMAVEQANELPMFFGDYISRIRLERDPQTSEYLLHIRAADVWPSDEKQLSDQAQDNIVVLVDVTIDADRDDVRVHGALSRPKHLPRPGNASGSYGLVRYRTRQALLDLDSRRQILELFRKAGGIGSERTQVLAKMNHKAFLDSRGSTVLFSYRRLSMDQAVPHHLIENDRIFLTGGRLKRSKNEVRLIFTISAQFASWNNAEDLDEVEVTRRNFSVREAVLRRHIDKGEDFLARRTFLVKLLKRTAVKRGPSAASWNGEVKDPPDRDARSLSGLLRATRTPAYATIVGLTTASEVRGLRLEIEAGTTVFLPLDRVAATNWERGSIVRIELDRSGNFDTFDLSLAIRGDRGFVETGRPAVVFPTNALNNCHDPAAVTTPCLVVAGLLDVQAYPGNATAYRGDGDALSRIMMMPHPKVVTLRQRTNLVSAIALEPDTRAAFVTVDPQCVAAEAVAILDPGDRRPMPWSNLSFADGTARDVLGRITVTAWWYNDQYTRTWRAGNPQEARPETVQMATPADQPLFFGSGWTLRYAEDEIRSLAYSTNELFDYTNMSDVVDVQGVVAGVVRDQNGTPVGLWVERAPGRVVEIMGDLVVLERHDEVPLSEPVPLASVHWAAFAPGDRIDFRVVGAGSDSPNLEFMSWRPGPRGAFGTQRVLLPVFDVDTENGAITLGAGQCVVTYPLTPGEVDGYLPGSPVWLYPDNRLRPATGLSDIWPDDVVLLVPHPTGATEIRPYAIHGVNIAVQPSDDASAWAGSEWLAEALRDTDRARELLQLCGGALPVTVEERDTNVITVSRRSQPPCALPPGSLVLATILGLLDDQVVLQAGPVLLTILPEVIVPGHPDAVRAELFDVLAARTTTMWMHVDNEGHLRPGVAQRRQSAAESSDLDISPEVVIGEDEAVMGIVCRRADTLGLAWLPAVEAAWTHLDREQLTHHLVQSSHLSLAHVRSNGTVSLIDAAPVRERFNSLGVGDTVRAVIVDKPVRRDRLPDRYVYLAKAYLTDILLEFESNYGGHRLSGEPVLAEVTLRRAGPSSTLSVVGHGERMIPIDLPHWLLRGARDPDYARNRFALYERCYGEPAEPLSLNPGEVTDADDRPDQASMQVVRAAGSVMMSGAVDGVARTALSNWLRRHGEEAFGIRSDGPLDLFPLLAVVQLLDTMGREPDLTAGAAAVELCRQIGLRAARSRHLEPLLTHWVLNPDRDTASRLWRRLTTLPWEPALPPKQFHLMYDCVSGLLPRAVATGDRELRLVSLSLLAALGRLPSFDDLEAYDGYLRELVNLGRSLTCVGNDPTAQPVLLDAQRDLLQGVVQELRDTGGVMTLLQPAITTGSAAGQALLERVLAELEDRVTGLPRAGFKVMG